MADDLIGLIESSLCRLEAREDGVPTTPLHKAREMLKSAGNARYREELDMAIWEIEARHCASAADRLNGLWSELVRNSMARRKSA